MFNKKNKTAFASGWIFFVLALFGTADHAAALGDVISNVTATASSTRSSSGQPIVAVDGSGLVGDAHDTDAANVWYANTYFTTPIHSFTADLGGIYNLEQIEIWNYNTDGTLWTTRRSVKYVNIYVSTTDPGAVAPGAGAPWVLAIGNQYLAPGTGAAGYNTPNIVEISATARYVGFLILQTHAMVDATQYYRPGFSEIRFREAPPSGTSVLIQ